MQEDRMLIQLDNGIEKEVHILFTFTNESKDYVVFEDINNDDGIVYAYIYDDQHQLTQIPDTDMEMIEEVIATFSEGEQS